MANQRTIVGLVLLLALAGGCANNDDGMSKAQVKSAEARDALLTKGGGKWDNLTADEKQQVMKEFGTQDEKEAQRFFERSASGENRPKVEPGAPNSGPPGR